MSGVPEPDWDFLPGNPMAFFGLSRGFEQRALKSKYGALIRRYKPETAPEKFQSIRAAYESLNGQFLSGNGAASRLTSFDPSTFRQVFQVTTSLPPPTPRSDEPPSPSSQLTTNDLDVTPPPPSIRTDEPTHSDESSNAEQSIDLQQPLDVHKSVDADKPIDADETVDPGSPHAHYEDFRKRPNKIPADFYALAILSDLVDDSSLGFAGWLLAGLDGFPREPRLSALLSAYFATPEAAADAEDLLVASSQHVRGDEFYDLTRPLWEHLIRASDMATFQRLLAACEANLDLEGSEQRLRFYLWVFKFAVWGRNSGWIERKIGEMDSHGQRLSHGVEREWHFVDLLSFYRPNRPVIVATGPLCRAMDRTLIDYATSSPDEGRRKLLECQTLIAGFGSRLVHQFPLHVKELNVLLSVWDYVSSEVGHHLGMGPLTWDLDASSPIRGLAKKLMTSGMRRGYHVLQFLGRTSVVVAKAILILLMSVLGFSQICIIVAAIVERKFGLLLATFLIAGLFFTLHWLWQLVLREEKSLSKALVDSYYRRVWRGDILQFLAENPIPLEHLKQHLASLNGQRVDGWRIQHTDQIAESLSQDVGVSILQIALPFAARRGGTGPS